MAHRFSNKTQSSTDTAYRFGDFELYPDDRLLTRAGVPVPLQPKSFDALLCLVRRAEHLVSKQELTNTLWPTVHVSEANLTNIIVGLRKILGREAIRTVSKHGYRFELAVKGEPGVARTTYERFIRARELTSQRSLESMQLARDLYWICVAEDPGFASAWAWLGRCCWFLDKFSNGTQADSELANAVFQRAFALDKDLTSAHQFFTSLQVDTGHAEEAMCRLLERLERHPGEPESYISLVHVLRFRGLLQESLAAHQRATELDPAAITSVAHTVFLTGDYASAIEMYSGRAAYYLDAAAWAALGDRKRAMTLLHRRLGRMPLSNLMAALMRSLLALLQGKRDEAVHLMEGASTAREPEIQMYFARHYAEMGLGEQAVSALKRASEAGFVCAPNTLNSDVWLRKVKKHPKFGFLVKAAANRVGEARSEFEGYTSVSKGQLL